MITKNDYEGMITEIGAGKVLACNAEADYTWNNACDRAVRIIRRYQDGEGLWQITEKNEKHPQGSGP